MFLLMLFTTLLLSLLLRIYYGRFCLKQNLID